MDITKTIENAFSFSLKIIMNPLADDYCNYIMNGESVVLVKEKVFNERVTQDSLLCR